MGHTKEESTIRERKILLLPNVCVIRFYITLTSGNYSSLVVQWNLFRNYARQPLHTVLVQKAATTAAAPMKTRKRGKRGRIRVKARARKYRPFVPQINFRNCRNMHNKVDELRVNCRFFTHV